MIIVEYEYSSEGLEKVNSFANHGIPYSEGEIIYGVFQIVRIQETGLLLIQNNKTIFGEYTYLDYADCKYIVVNGDPIWGL